MSTYSISKWFAVAVAVIVVILLILCLTAIMQRDAFKKQRENLSTAYKSHLANEYIHNICKIEFIGDSPRVISPQDAACVDGVRMRVGNEVDAIAK